MSWRDRLRKVFRREAWKDLYEYSSDETVPSVFVPDLVSGEYTNKDSWTHLLKVSREDPLAYRICVQMSHNVFDDWFVIHKREDLEEGEEPTIHPKNAQIQEEFHRMRAKFWFTQALIGMKTFGRSFQIMNYNRHRFDIAGEGFQVATLDVFTEENTQIPAEGIDPATGTPSYIEVWPNADFNTLPDQIPWSQVVFWCTQPKGRSYDGYSELYSVWDVLTQARESLDAMAWSHKKFGVGLFAVYLKGALDSEIYDATEAMVQGIGNKRAALVEQDKYEKLEWIGPSSSGTTAIVEGIDLQLGLISAGTGIPKDIFTGVSAGAITGSEVNNKALYAKISKDQSDIEPKIFETLEHMGYNTDDMTIGWNTRYASDEVEQATIRNLNADAELKEAQAERGDIMIGVQGMGGDFKDPDKKQNMAGKQG